jgi:CheY-like chemotaxis protein
MTATVLASTIPQALSRPFKKKRVLLVDTSATKRDLRAETMRKLGMEVDCAADITEARSWWRADLYDLVLISGQRELSHREKFCDDIRGANPPQQVAFLVGKPDYLADSPNADGALSKCSVEEDDGQRYWADVRTALSADVAESPPQRWGILEASRRISVVRSLCHARSKAIRERPAPRRDLEIRYSKATAVPSDLSELAKEEMQ